MAADQLAMTQSPTLYVGLDFGTQQSGFSTAALGSNVRFMEIYPEQPVPCCKTLTMLLYMRQASGWHPISWGWSAYHNYQQLPSSERSQYLLLER